MAENIKTSIIRKEFDANSFEAGAGRTNQLDMRKQFTADRKKNKELWDKWEIETWNENGEVLETLMIKSKNNNTCGS